MKNILYNKLTRIANMCQIASCITIFVLTMILSRFQAQLLPTSLLVHSRRHQKNVSSYNLSKKKFAKFRSDLCMYIAKFGIAINLRFRKITIEKRKNKLLRKTANFSREKRNFFTRYFAKTFYIIYVKIACDYFFICNYNCMNWINVLCLL